MKHIAMILAVILGIIPGVTAKPATADMVVEPVRTEVYTGELFHKDKVHLKEARRNNIIEVNFTIRIFLWSLGQGETAIVKRSMSDPLKVRFVNDQSMIFALNLAHRPMHNAKSIFLHEPEFTGQQVIQPVYVVDGTGKHWKATYMLDRNEQNRFTITDIEFTQLKGTFS